MTAPVPLAGDQDPLWATAAYQTKQFGSSDANSAGLLSTQEGVFSHLNAPPASGVAAEEAIQSRVEDVATGDYTYPTHTPSVGTT